LEICPHGSTIGCVGLLVASAGWITRVGGRVMISSRGELHGAIDFYAVTINLHSSVAHQQKDFIGNSLISQLG
jgi:hypothetical protein